MMQHINLLPTRRGSAHGALTLNRVALAACAATALAVAAGAWVVPQTARLKTEAAALRKQVAANEAALASRSLALDTATAQRLAEVRARTARTGEAAARLRELGSQEQDRFSSYFAALSRQTMHGVWITAFSADGQQRQLVLVGRALNPELVPGYLQRLQREPAFQNRRFASLNVEDRPAAPASVAAPESGTGMRIVEFRLQSAGRDGAARDDARRSGS